MLVDDVKAPLRSVRFAGSAKDSGDAYQNVEGARERVDRVNMGERMYEIGVGAGEVARPMRCQSQ